jgi:hypothetical protein
VGLREVLSGSLAPIPLPRVVLSLLGPHVQASLIMGAPGVQKYAKYHSRIGKSKSSLFANVVVTQSEHNSESLLYTELSLASMLQTTPQVRTIKDHFACTTLREAPEGP